MPPKLLEALDRKLANPGESRSATIRRLLEAALREKQAPTDIERYLQGYRDQPQTEEEFGWSDDTVKCREDVGYQKRDPLCSRSDFLIVEQGGTANRLWTKASTIGDKA
jgi:hypothetical protein